MKRIKAVVKIFICLAFFSTTTLLAETNIPPPPKKIEHPPPNKKPFIVGTIHNQLGNQMFEIAATLSLALDHNAEALFPGLCSNHWFYKGSRKYVFWRLNTNTPDPSSITSEYIDHGIPYRPISYSPNMRLTGVFQSEKYFSHHKKKFSSFLNPTKALSIIFIKNTLGSKTIKKPLLSTFAPTIQYILQAILMVQECFPSWERAILKRQS